MLMVMHPVQAQAGRRIARRTVRCFDASYYSAAYPDVAEPMEIMQMRF